MVKNRHTTLSGFLFSVLIFFPGFIFSQVSGSKPDDGSTVYDVVDPKTMEIDADFNLEHYTANGTGGKNKLQLGVQADLKYFNAPNLTFRYGVVKNFELQLITGYTGVLTKGQISIKTKQNRIIKALKNETGLSSPGLGFKAGLMKNKHARPSLAFTGIFTLPNIGDPLFTPNNAGADLSFNMYNSLSEDADIAYDIGTNWSGYYEDPHNSYNYTVSPGFTFSDDFGLYLDFAGILEKGFTPDNRIDIDMSFALGDYVTLDTYIGTSFNIKKFYYLGATLTTTIPF